MRENQPTPLPAVVVGVDGSRAALTAALWAVDEAVSRDIPLRLVYAIEPKESSLDPQRAAHDLATAEIAVREATMAIESLEQPVKVEMVIVQDRPEQALATASCSAALLCIGALGRDHAIGRRVGSVAAAISRVAHCPVAIIRGHEPMPRDARWVVAEADGSLDGDAVLEYALAEARLRGAPLRVLALWQSRDPEIEGARAVDANSRLLRAELDRRLERWRRRFPDLDLQTDVARGTTLDYVAEHMKSIQLLVVGQQRGSGLGTVAGPAAQAALHDTNCSVLICPHHGAL